MNELEFLKIKAAIYEVGLLFNQQPSEEKINAYAKALSNYTPKQITYAFNKVILSESKFFPSLSEVLVHLRPRDITSADIGNNVANEIIQKVIDWGSHRLVEAYNDLSELAKKVIGNNTYILHEIAHSQKEQLGTIRAQIRDMVKGSVEHTKQAEQNKVLERLGLSSQPKIDKGQGMRAVKFDEF